MREKRSKKQTQKTSKTDKVYNRKEKKAISKAKTQAALNATKIRKERWDKALKAIPVEQILPHLNLQLEGKIICPHCKEKDSLEFDQKQNHFSCKECKCAGHAIGLVKRVLGITPWKAVAFIEELITSLAEKTQEKAAKKPQKETAQIPTKQGQNPKPKAKEKPLVFPELPSYSSHPFEDRIKKVKANNRIEDVVEKVAGANLKKSGSNLVCRCPFPDHEDKTPSFFIRSNHQSFKCFGCDKSGDVLNFLMLYKSISLPKVLDFLDPVEKALLNPPSTLHSEKINPQQLVTLCCDFFHNRLGESMDAKTFLHDRSLWSSELVSHFKLGFDDGKINGTLSDEIKSSLEKTGYLSSKGNMRFYRCLTIGLQDEHSNFVSIYGRRIEANGKGSKHQFAKGNIKGVFNPVAIKASETLILTEGVLDALSVWLMGYRNVSCIFSVSNIPTLLLELIAKSHVKTIYLALDNDKQGDLTCPKFAALLNRQIELKRIQFPKKIKDANEFLMTYKKEKAAPLFDELMQNATPLLVPNSNTTTQIANSQKPIVEVKKEEIIFSLEDRTYKIRGFAKNLSFDSIRITLQVFKGDLFHVDTLELYNFRQRNLFIKTAASELCLQDKVIKRDIGKIFLKLEELQADQINKNLEPKKKEVILTEKEQQQALELLRDPNLLQRVVEDFGKCGLIGEKTNILVSYISLTSRKLEDPLAVIVQALSSAGKTALMNTALSFIPTEDQVKYTAMTGQSLFYMGEGNLVHKVLAISEEAGAEKAAYPIKIMQSEKRLCIASTGKDPKTGKFTTHEYTVEGPAQIIMTTTSVEIDEELQNRCLVLTVDERREQTQAIHRKQREKETLKGQIEQQERDALVKLHQNAQRLLKPIMVVNPYAKYLSFPDNRLRARRDQVKYLTLIRSIALLHQYQRPIEHENYQGQSIPYIKVTLEDLETANFLVKEIMGISLDDLAPQTRRFLELLTQMVQEHCKKNEIAQTDFLFNRKMVREHLGWSDFQVRTHLAKLVDLEYILVRGGNGGRSYLYELLYQGEAKEDERFIIGLIDVKKLRQKLKNDNAAG